MVTYTQKFGQFVKRRRLEIGETQNSLCLKVFKKVNISYFSMLENGTLEGITFKTAEKILQALDAEIVFKGKD